MGEIEVVHILSSSYLENYYYIHTISQLSLFSTSFKLKKRMTGRFIPFGEYV